jgi:hypothetical protein
MNNKQKLSKWGKRSFNQAIFLFALVLASCNNQVSESRLTKNINTDWTFNYFPSQELNEETLDPDFDDSAWPAVALPHTWSTYETTGDIHPFIKYPSEKDDTYWWYGWGVYRKKLRFDPSLRDKEIFIELDGVQKYSKVYLNGNYIGDHKGGFTSFYFPLTNHINWEGENILSVAVNGRRDDQFAIPPMIAGNWDVYSGIYRDVRIVAKNKVHFPYQGSYKHEGGVFITTPTVNNNSGTVNIRSFLKNSSEESVSVKIAHEIVSPKGEVIFDMESKLKIEAGEIKELTLQTEKIDNISLWSPETPVLYQVISSVFMDGKLADQITNPLGFRYFHWDYETDDLYVNGKKTNIKGMNRHQEYPWLGDAHPKWIAKMDLEDIKYNLGHNFMRLTHYPNDEYLYQLADSMGIVMVEEVPNIKRIDFNEEVQEQNVREMIRRDRNHPSIFFWSMGNETSDAADSKWAVEEDTTRIIHLRKGHEGGDFIEHTDENLDMEALLRVTIRGWFDVDDAPQGFTSEPEYGQHAGNETWQHEMAQVRGGSIRGLLGDNTSAWLYEDHGADREYLNCILKHINPKGWVDMYRQPKYVYWLTKAVHTDIPTVFIHPHFWREKYLGQRKTITIDSNCDEVELFANGRSLGKRIPDKANFYTIDYENVEIERGELKLTGIKNGKKVETKVYMPGAPAKIKLKTTQKEIRADRSGIAIVEANIVDENGYQVFDATNTLNWKVDGPGKLVGHDVYETDIKKYEEWKGTGYTVVPVCNVIRSTHEAGTIKISVSSPGLEPAIIEIESVLPEKTASPIIEFALSDNGRKPIKKDTAFSKKITLVTALFTIRENHTIAGETKEEIANNLIAFIGERNHYIDKSTVGFQTIMDVLTQKLLIQNGILIADDYNFIAEQFNIWFALEQMIKASGADEKTKSSALEKYAISIIKNAEPVDLDKEKLMWNNYN